MRVTLKGSSSTSVWCGDGGITHKTLKKSGLEFDFLVAALIMHIRRFRCGRKSAVELVTILET